MSEARTWRDALMDADLPVIALAVGLLALGGLAGRRLEERLVAYDGGGVQFVYPEGWLAGAPDERSGERTVEITDALGGDPSAYKPRVFVRERDDPPAAYARFLAANVEVDEQQRHDLFDELGTHRTPLAGGPGTSSLGLDFAFATKPAPDDLPVVVETKEIAILHCSSARSCDHLYVVGVSAPLEDWQKQGSLYERILASVELGSTQEDRRPR